MQIILLERVVRLGQMGDEVRVRDGFARNYLLPQGKALRANDANRKQFDAQRSQFETRNLERKDEATKIAEKLKGLTLVLVRQAAETGHLYGSVTPRDLAEAVTEAGFSVSRGQVNLSHPIKAIGLHTIAINLHADVEASVIANVARSADEAERQALGEDLTAGGHEEHEAEAVAVEGAADDNDVDTAQEGREGEAAEEMQASDDDPAIAGSSAESDSVDETD